MKPLRNISIKDSSRQFLSLPESHRGEPFREHLAKLPDVAMRNFLADHTTEFPIDFSYEGHAFSVHHQFGAFLFSVSDSHCCDTVLEKVVVHGAAFFKTQKGPFPIPTFPFSLHPFPFTFTP